MRAGRLDREIVLQQRTNAQDSFGQPVASWADVATVWAAKEDERGREYFAAQQLQAVAPTRFRIRYRGDLVTTTNHRVVYGGQVWDIRAVAQPPAPRDREVFLYCDTGLTQG